MSSFTHLIRICPPIRLMAVSLMGATMLASPLTAAHADAVTGPAIQLAQASPQSPAGAGATGVTESKGETVEQRIANLHAALKITPDQEAKWKQVAQDMRENAAAMDKLIAETRTTPPQNMSAVDDLKMYQKFSQAHVDGIKNLLSHFEAFYAAMPDGQKKIADEVFRSTKN